MKLSMGSLLNLLKINTSQYIEPQWYAKHIAARPQGLPPQSAATKQLRIDRAKAKRARKAQLLQGNYLKCIVCNPYIPLPAALGVFRYDT